MFWSKFFENHKLMDKNKEIDKQACTKFLTDGVKNSPFKDMEEKIVTECLDDTAKNAENYQTDKRIPKDKCLVKYDYMTDCVKLTMFQVS